jgi:Ca2+-binding RTX toxin-like protein
MARFVVDTVRDRKDPNDGVLSLREAVDRANGTTGADTILFASALEGRTLVLSRGELEVTRDLTIDGDRNDDGVGVTLSGGDADGILVIKGASNARLEFALSGVNLQDGRGDALNASYADVAVDHALIRDNAGHGIYIYESGPSGLTVASSEIVGNGRDGIDGNYAGVTVERSLISRNGGMGITAYGPISVTSSTISGNDGSGIQGAYSTITVDSSTIANNTSRDGGGGIQQFPGFPSYISISNSTITGNRAIAGSDGGGVLLERGTLDVANSIIAGNTTIGGGSGEDVAGALTASNGHNVFGSDVAGQAIGDREGVAASAIFASLDRVTGGGALDAANVARLRADPTNPAIAGADRLVAGPVDQLGADRPAPGGTNPDIGAVESGAATSTRPSAGNDTLSLTVRGDTVDALGGNDTVYGLGGGDLIGGGDGNDYLEGGAGDDTLDGGIGVDLVSYRDSRTAVVVDLRGTAPGDSDVARRGAEVDTIRNVEGAVGGAGDDTFYGDARANAFQGGGGSDLFFGGDGVDRYDYNIVSSSERGSRRDVIADYDELDIVDLRGIDADTTRAGNQRFRWVDDEPLSGPGEVGYVVRGDIAIIRASTDADATAEFEIGLATGGFAPQGDFLL